MRNIFCWNLYTHITSGNHNSISNFDNFIKIFNTLCILNLSDNRNISTMLP